MDALATRVAVVGDGDAALFWGNYTDYCERTARSHAPVATPKARRRKAAPAAPAETMSKNRLRRLQREWKAIFDKVAATEASIEDIEARMARPAFFEDRERSREVAREYEELKAALPALFERLEGLDHQLGGRTEP